MPAIVPTLAMPNVDQAVRYYADEVGCEILWVHHRGDMGSVCLAGLAWKTCRFMLIESPPGNADRIVRIVLDDWRELANVLRERGTLLAQHTPSAGWTDALMTVIRDPFGVEWHLFDAELWSRETAAV